MITYDELNYQNHRITELSNVLRYLFAERTMCDTKTCCDMFKRYLEVVQEHIDIVDRDMYSDLLKSNDRRVNNTAKNFMSGSIEVKKILREFTNRWCPTKGHKDLRIDNYDEFLLEINQLFDIVLERILNETEKLYPMVRSLNKAA